MPTNGSQPTEALAAYIVGGEFRDLPSAMVDAVKASILDTLGVAMAGAVEPVGKIVTAYVKDLGGNPQATVLGSGLRTSP